MAGRKKDEEPPLPKQHLKFCDNYFHLRDLKKAAVSVGLHPDDGKRLWKDKRIRSRIKHLEDIAAAENAKMRIRADQLTVQLLDKELTDTVSIDLKDVKKAPALGAVKVKAIELGYERIGIKRADGFIVKPPGEGQAAPQFYRALETVTQRTTQETIVQRELSASSGAPALAPRQTLPPPEPQEDDANSYVWNY